MCFERGGVRVVTKILINKTKTHHYHHELEEIVTVTKSGSSVQQTADTKQTKQNQALVIL